MSYFFNGTWAKMLLTQKRTSVVSKLHLKMVLSTFLIDTFFNRLKIVEMRGYNIAYSSIKNHVLYKNTQMSTLLKFVLWQVHTATGLLNVGPT